VTSCPDHDRWIIPASREKDFEQFFVSIKINPAESTGPNHFLWPYQPVELRR
jgi:hypothetical protein